MLRKMIKDQKLVKNGTTITMAPPDIAQDKRVGVGKFHPLGAGSKRVTHLIMEAVLNLQVSTLENIVAYVESKKKVSIHFNVGDIWLTLL